MDSWYCRLGIPAHNSVVMTLSFHSTVMRFRIARKTKFRRPSQFVFLRFLNDVYSFTPHPSFGHPLPQGERDCVVIANDSEAIQPF